MYSHSYYKVFRDIFSYVLVLMVLNIERGSSEDAEVLRQSILNIYNKDYNPNSCPPTGKIFLSIKHQVSSRTQFELVITRRTLLPLLPFS